MAAGTIANSPNGSLIPELARKIEAGEVTVIDVRTVGEFRSGHVPLSINIPMDEFESRIDDVPTDRPVVMVCQSGRRSQMTREMAAGRIGEIACLDGGIDAWTKAGHRLVRSTRTRLALDRQAMIGASVLILLSVALGSFVSPAWYYLALVPGVGLMLAGAAGVCLMAILLSFMPWNKVRC